MTSAQHRPLQQTKALANRLSIRHVCTVCSRLCTGRESWNPPRTGYKTAHLRIEIRIASLQSSSFAHPVFDRTRVGIWPHTRPPRRGIPSLFHHTPLTVAPCSRFTCALLGEPHSLPSHFFTSSLSIADSRTQAACHATFSANSITPVETESPRSPFHAFALPRSRAFTLIFAHKRRTLWAPSSLPHKRLSPCSYLSDVHS